MELIRYLAANGFKVYICTGGSVEFVRAISKDFYGIPPEQVIGTAFDYEFTPNRSQIIIRPKLTTLNDKEEKAANIQKIIGKRPVFAVGNVKSGGDVFMLRYSQGAPYPSYQLMINHDDSRREFAYEKQDEMSLVWANIFNWHVVSMKNDWNNIFKK